MAAEIPSTSTEKQINLVINKLTKATLDQLSAAGRLSSDLSDQLFMTADESESAAGVTRIIAGQDIRISPSDGTGEVTICADGLAHLKGSTGQVPYYDEVSGFALDNIYDTAYIFQTSADAEQFATYQPSMKTIFDQWSRFGIGGPHQMYQDGDTRAVISDDQYFAKYSERRVTNGGTLYIDTNRSIEVPGMMSWEYDISAKCIRQTTNAGDFNGFVSREKFRDYEFVVNISSSGSDNDANAVVAAFAMDSDERIHTVSFVRTPSDAEAGRTHHFACVLDFRSERTIGIDQTGTDCSALDHLVLKNSGLTYLNDADKGWINYPFGVTMKIKRVGNKFYGSTSEFLSTAEWYTEFAAISVDLDEVYADPATTEGQKKALSLFINKPIQVGFGNRSQGGSTYTILKYPSYNTDIVDLQRNIIKTYDTDTFEWELIPGMTPIDYLKVGKIHQNYQTKKLFYNDSSEIKCLTEKCVMTEGENVLYGNYTFIPFNTVTQSQKNWDIKLSSDSPDLRLIVTSLSGIDYTPEGTKNGGVYVFANNLSTVGEFAAGVNPDGYSYSLMRTYHTKDDSTKRATAILRSTGETREFRVEADNLAPLYGRDTLQTKLGLPDYRWAEIYGWTINVLSTSVYPISDHVDLGNGTMAVGGRWENIYSKTALDVASDSRIKQEVEPIPEAMLSAWDGLEFVQFKLADAVEEKGPLARLHTGLIAQSVGEKLSAAGVDADRYGMYCYDEFRTGVGVNGVQLSGLYSLRYEECFAVEAAYQRWKYRQLESKYEDLLARVEALEGK